MRGYNNPVISITALRGGRHFDPLNMLSKQLTLRKQATLIHFKILRTLHCTKVGQSYLSDYDKKNYFR